MFDKITSTVKLPIWATKIGGDSRFKRLELHDRLLDGTFYDHLVHGFYDEKNQSGAIIPLIERRPSAQYRLPRMVARWCARKLFAGRYAPKIRHKDAKLAKRVTGLLRKAKFMPAMSEAVLLGSVGSVAVTFRIEKQRGNDPKIAIQLWRAKFCVPSFDTMGELAQLRVQYLTTGSAFIAMGVPASANIAPTEFYWYVRDFTPKSETTYLPVKKDDWNPVDGFTDTNKKFVPWGKAGEAGSQVFDHDLGFVPGHWFRNLPGGIAPDGACTFEDAIPNSIELDYTLSQIGRGVRYNCAPTLAIVGDLVSDVTRGTITHIQMKAGFKSEDGITTEGGSAELLEMNGTGTTAALEMIKTLRNMALEQIAASRKDPDKMKAPLSGRAMEFLDEDANDLIMDLRNHYGEDGALPLLKKIIEAAGESKDVSGFSLQWPRLYQPTPDEVFALVQALVLAIDPMKRAAAATPGSKPASAQGAYVEPTPATAPEEDEQLLTMEEARLILGQALDLTMLDVKDDEASEDADVDTSPTPPEQQTPAVPLPVSVDEVPPSEQGAAPAGGVPNSAVNAVGGGMPRVSAPVSIDA